MDSEEELPTLYQSILNYETIAVEIRKQNKALTRLASVLESQEEEESAILEEDINNELLLSEIKKQDDVLISFLESINHLRNQSLEVSNQVDIELKKGIFPFRKRSREHVSSLNNSFFQGITLLYEKLLSALTDRGIEPIDPAIGSTFNPQQHRAVENLTGSIPATIAKVVKTGYQQHGIIKKYADVIVYKK